MQINENSEASSRFVTMNDLRRGKEHDPLWVINTSENVSNPKGDVIISCRRADGNSITLVVPTTWLPYDLSEMAPRNAILNSSHFIDALRSTTIQAVSEEYAQTLLSQEGAKTERQRLEARDLVVKAATQVNGIGKNVRITTGDEDDFADENQSLLDRVNRANGNNANISVGDIDDPSLDLFPGVASVFKSWVTKNNDLSEAAAVNDLKVRGSLNGDEAEYYRQNSKHPRIIAYLNGKLGKR